MYRIIRSYPGTGVCFSHEDRSPYVYISSDALSLTTDRGFRAARANCPIREGRWYFEVVVERGGGEATGVKREAHVRVGIGRREAALGAPVGFDGHSYGVRDKTGDKVTLSKPEAYGQPVKSGDVIGVMVDLPLRLRKSPDTQDTTDPARIARKRIPIRYKGQLYFEALEYEISKEMAEVANCIADNGNPAKAKQVRQKAAAPGTKSHLNSKSEKHARPLPKLHGSSVSFFCNGRNMDPSSEPAFSDLYDWLPLRQHSNQQLPASKKKPGRIPKAINDRTNHHDDGSLGYYPFVSVFGGGIVKLNPGPSLHFEPSGAVSGWRPLSERYDEYMEELRLLDEEDENDAWKRMPREIQAAMAQVVPAMDRSNSDMDHTLLGTQAVT